MPEYRKISKLFFEPKGTHDPAEAYTIMDVVTSADGSVAYAALQDVPEGVALDDASYWMRVIDMSYTMTAMQTALAAYGNAAKAIGQRVKGEIATATGNPVTCLPDAGSVLDVTTVFEPKQEGEGEASPENPRPISPWDGISLQHGETVYSDAFDTPIPGGSKNWLSGVLTQDWYIQELSGASKESWKRSSTQSGGGVYRYDGTISGSRRSAGNECICSHAVYRGVNEPGIWLTNTQSTSNTVLAVRFMGTWPTLDDFKAWLAEAKPQIAYKIAKPVETQFAPAIITATEPEQENTLSGDGVISVDYVKPLHVSIDERVAAAMAAMTNG